MLICFFICSQQAANCSIVMLPLGMSFIIMPSLLNSQLTVHVVGIIMGMPMPPIMGIIPGIMGMPMPPIMGIIPGIMVMPMPPITGIIPGIMGMPMPPIIPGIMPPIIGMPIAGIIDGMFGIPVIGIELFIMAGAVIIGLSPSRHEQR